MMENLEEMSGSDEGQEVSVPVAENPFKENQELEDMRQKLNDFEIKTKKLESESDYLRSQMNHKNKLLL